MGSFPFRLTLVVIRGGRYNFASSKYADDRITFSVVKILFSDADQPDTVKILPGVALPAMSFETFP